MAEQKIRDWRRAARAAIHSYPDIKQKTKDATNSDLWGPTDAQKCEIAEASHNAENRALVLKALWKRVEDKTEYWMHVYKALDVLEYLLLCNVPEMMNELKFHHQMISNLQMYAHAKHKDPMEQNKLNEKVRVKAGRLMRLMSDASLLDEERKKLRLIMARITGISDQEIEGGSSAPSSSTAAPAATRAPPPASRPGASGNRGSMNLPGHTAEAGRTSSVGGDAQAGDEFELDLNVLTQVMDMGFTDQDAVVSAMMAADNNLERTVQYLVNNPTTSSSASPASAEPPSSGVGNAATAGPSAPIAGGQQQDASLGGRGMTDLFTPAPTVTANTTGGGGGATTTVNDLFGGATAATTTPAVAVAHTTPAGGQGLWNGEMNEPNRTAANPVPQTTTGFDPFAPQPAPQPAPTTSVSGPTTNTMPDFFSTTQTPQEAHKRGGMSPPPSTSGVASGQQQQVDLFGGNGTTQQQQQQQQSTDLFGSGAPPPQNPPPAQQQTDLFGGAGSGPVANNSTTTTITSNDLFGSGKTQQQVVATSTSSTVAPASSAPSQPKKELTPQEKMMMEFQNMGALDAKKK